MDCKDCHELLPRALDGELDGAQRSEFEKHLTTCPACQREYENQRTLKTALKDKALQFKAPEDLKVRIRAQTQSQPPRSALRPWMLGLVAALLCVSLLGWAYVHLTSQAAENALTQEVVSAHIRSLMASHLSDVASTDQHTVKPWFAGKLDFSPVVGDFPEQDFKLVGGRLDYLRGRPVAALIYKHRQHVINLFTWPGDGERTPSIATVRNGYNVLSWQQSGMNFWLASDLNLGEMAELKTLIQTKNGTP